MALTPGGERISLDGDGPEVLELTEQGFYEFRTQGRDGDAPLVVASNVDLSESDLAPRGSAGSRRRGDGSSGGQLREERRRRRQLTRRRKARSGSGGTCSLRACCCSVSKPSWRTDPTV